MKPYAFAYRDQEGKIAHIYLHAKDHADAEQRLDRARMNGEAQEVVTMATVPDFVAPVFGGRSRGKWPKWLAKVFG